MKLFFDGIIVVEGKNDASYLSSFVDTVFVITNGYEIPQKEIEFLNNSVKHNKQIVVLTDSDEAGYLIREKLNKLVPESTNKFVDLSLCNKKDKHGVAECEKNELLRVLSSFCMEKPFNKGNLSLNNLEDLHIKKEEREYVCSKLSLGICNSKTFLKRLNFLGISKDELKGAINSYGN